MNGELFAGMKQLEWVNLGGNLCIDVNYREPDKIATLPRLVTLQCGFVEKVCAFLR